MRKFFVELNVFEIKNSRAYLLLTCSLLQEYEFLTFSAVCHIKNSCLYNLQMKGLDTSNLDVQIVSITELT